MEREEYDCYIDRSEFCNFAGRTLEGLHGLIWAKSLIIEVPENCRQYLDDVDGNGNSINQFANDSSWDSIQTGFGGFFVDSANFDDMSMREMEDGGFYPYISYFRAEQILNRRYESAGRRQRLVYVILEEMHEVPTVNKFTYELKKRFRVLELDEEGYYKHSLYDEREILISESYPKMFGKRMRFIPFFFTPTTKPYKPMMKDICDLNIAWWKLSCDLRNALHYIGVPTPVCLGYVPETEYDENGNEIPKVKLRLGGNKILYFPQGTTSVHYLELSGSALSNLTNEMTNDEERMAILGARIISQERKGVEAAETARIHRAGENSVIATFANEFSEALTNAMRCYLEWCIGSPISDDIKFQLNTDYDVSKMTPSELTALVSLWQSGGISKRILFKNLQEGEIIENTLSFEEVEDEIEEEKEKNTSPIQLVKSVIESEKNKDENQMEE